MQEAHLQLHGAKGICDTIATDTASQPSTWHSYWLSVVSITAEVTTCEKEAGLVWRTLRIVSCRTHQSPSIVLGEMLEYDTTPYVTLGTSLKSFDII